MKKRKVIAVLVLALGIAGAVFLARPSRPALPVYQGKTARQWFGELPTTNRKQAQDAFYHMGSNAFPFLVHELERTNSAWDRFCVKGYSKLPQSIRKHLAWQMSDDFRWATAVSWLKKLGAKPAIQDLMSLLPDKTADQQCYVLIALSNLVDPENTNCIPALVNYLNSTNGEVQVEALNALERIGPDKRAIPALTDLLRWPNADVHQLALDYLSQIDLKLAQKYGYISLPVPPSTNSQPDPREK